MINRIKDLGKDLMIMGGTGVLAIGLTLLLNTPSKSESMMVLSELGAITRVGEDFFYESNNVFITQEEFKYLTVISGIPGINVTLFTQKAEENVKHD